MKRFWLRHRQAITGPGLVMCPPFVSGALAAYGVHLLCRYGKYMDDGPGLWVMCALTLGASCVALAALTADYLERIIEDDDVIIDAVCSAVSSGWDVRYDDVFHLSLAVRDLGCVRFAIWKSAEADIWKLSMGTEAGGSVLLCAKNKLSDVFAFHDRFSKDLKEKL